MINNRQVYSSRLPCLWQFAKVSPHRPDKRATGREIVLKSGGTLGRVILSTEFYVLPVYVESLAKHLCTHRQLSGTKTLSRRALQSLTFSSSAPIHPPLSSISKNRIRTWSDRSLCARWRRTAHRLARGRLFEHFNIAYSSQTTAVSTITHYLGEEIADSLPPPVALSRISSQGRHQPPTNELPRNPLH